ncbi:MAG TPA: DUF4388 domain-containing protein [Thermoanaerobaculia bacterium]|nr:DUF4388 domain-containing protein [Thermoanaerobaculia bacterium]
MAIAGNLRTMQLSELLQWLSTGLKSGTLVVRGAPGEKRIYFENGRVTSSSSTLEREHLGRFLVGFGFITEEELIRALEVQQESRILLGKILVMIGAIKETELADLVRLKAAETIYDIFLWTEGSFAFIDGEVPQLPMVPISSDVTGIVMEGLRRYDEWQRIKTKITSMRQIPTVTDPVETTLGDREKLIVGAINGHRAIDQIALETHNPEFHVAKLVYDLMQSGHVVMTGEREEAPVASVFSDADTTAEAEAASAFDPILGASRDDASPEPRPRVEEYVLAPPPPRTPPPTDFGRFLKRGPDSDVTLRRKPKSGESAVPALRTAAPAAPAPADSSATNPAAGSATRPAAASPKPDPSPAPAQAAPSPARALHAQAPAEPRAKVPASAVPILTKPMEELMSFAFTPNEAFIVSRINGMWDVKSIARISPFPESEVMRVFAKLQTSGVISFR